MHGSSVVVMELVSINLTSNRTEASTSGYCKLMAFTWTRYVPAELAMVPWTVKKLSSQVIGLS